MPMRLHLTPHPAALQMSYVVVTKNLVALQINVFFCFWAGWTQEDKSLVCKAFLESRHAQVNEVPSWCGG